ncbi:MAG TPA: hypothetical protein VIZ17_03470 [Acetobacteraceae bacterium]
MARPITMRTYLASLAAASLLAFALVWGWVAFAPLAFLEPEYPAWLAKERMLAACDIGTVLVVGDSRAAVDIEPGLLPVRTTNLAVGGGEPIEALSAVQRALACPRPPARVIVSFDAGHFMQPDLLWERSVGFGFLDHAAIDQLRTVSRQLGDASIYGMARADRLPPWLRAKLYQIRFPSLYFASLLHGGVFLRWWENRAALDRAIAARGQYFFGTQDGSSAIAVEGHLDRFAPLPVLDWYFDRMLAALAARGIAVDFVAMPTNDTTWRQVRAPLAKGFAAYLAADAARYPNFHVVGTVLPHWPDKWFGDSYAHLNPAGAALFSRQFGDWLDRVVPRVVPLGAHAFSDAEPPASSSVPAGPAGPPSPLRHSPGPTRPG